MKSWVISTSSCDIVPGQYPARPNLRLRRAELLACFDEPTTNGYAEGVINKVELIKRRAYGLPSLNASPERVLLACARTGPRSASPLDRREPIFQPGRLTFLAPGSSADYR